MAVLLLRLCGPMQSWGLQGRFDIRDTQREPTKSGVVGLLGAAIGMSRYDTQQLSRLAALRMGVRVDREGRLFVDYHTVGGGKVPGIDRYRVPRASGQRGEDPVVSRRWYLADADFLVGMEGDDEDFLKWLDQKLADPVWPLYLGRKSCPPSEPVRIGVQHGKLEEVLRRWPWRARRKGEKPESPLRLVFETSQPSPEARLDQPTSFDPLNRRYRIRYVRTEWLMPDEVMVEEVGK